VLVPVSIRVGDEKGPARLGGDLPGHLYNTQSNIDVNSNIIACLDLPRDFN
jgi:hypothetical protein